MLARVLFAQPCVSSHFGLEHTIAERPDQEANPAIGPWGLVALRVRRRRRGA